MHFVTILSLLMITWPSVRSYYCHLRKHHPASIPCGLNGTFVGNDGVQGNLTYDRCVNLCLKRGDCTGYSFDPLEFYYHCTLYSRPLLHRDIVANSSSSRQFWSTKCYNCSGKCPASGNLISNGGFETGQLGPWRRFDSGGIDNPSAKIVSPGHNSEYALELEGGASQPIDGCTNATYLLSLDVKPVNEATTVLVSPGFLEAYLKIAAGNWSTISFYFTPNVFGFSTGAGFASELAKVLFDNIAVTTVQSVAAKPGSVELVSNGGFESGTLGPWIFYNNTSHARYEIIKPGFDSTYAFKGESFGLGHSVNFVTNTPYLLSFYYRYRSFDSNFTSCTIDIPYYEDEGFLYYNLDLPPKRAWERSELVFIPEGNATSIIFACYALDGRSHIYIDDFSIKELNV